MASFTQQFWNSPRCTLSFSECVLLSRSSTPVSSSAVSGNAAASAAATGSEPPLPGSNGRRPQVSVQARRNASKANPETSTRCGLPSRYRLTVTSAPHGARLRRCFSTERNARCVSSPGARRMLTLAVATGTSCCAAVAVGGASIPRTAIAGRAQSRSVSGPSPRSRTPGRSPESRRSSASLMFMSCDESVCNPSTATSPLSLCSVVISLHNAVSASGIGPPYRPLCTA